MVSFCAVEGDYIAGYIGVVEFVYLLGKFSVGCGCVKFPFAKHVAGDT